MTTWNYKTLMFITHHKDGCGWGIVQRDLSSDLERVGESEKPRFIGKVWQAARLLETALAELDLDGWELVSTSYSGTIGFYGLAVVRRAAVDNPSGSGA